jgi:hypothetical protein
VRPTVTAGIVVLILAVGVAASLMGAILIASWQGRPLNEPAATMLSTIMGAMIGAIAGYVGAHRGRQREDDKPPDDKPEP